MTEIHIFYPLLFVLAIIIIFVLARVYNDKLNFKKDIHFKDKDVEITSEAFKRIGEVKDGTPNEVILNLQNVENNKEIYISELDYEKLSEEEKNEWRKKAIEYRDEIARYIMKGID